MHITAQVAQEIDLVEAEVTRLVVGSPQPAAFWRPFEGGAASFVRAGSPINKVIAAGLAAPLDDAALSQLEADMRERGEPVRVELATLAEPATGEALTRRGYRLMGFEDVLVRPLATPNLVSRAGVDVQEVSTFETWRTITVDSFAHADGTGTPVDAFTRETIEQAMNDLLGAERFERYLGLVDGQPAGAASMLVHGRIVLLTGSATLPAFRGRGVQTALIAARLDAARARGAELAVITTAPGSRSEANCVKHGFALGYARAILVGGDAS